MKMTKTRGAAALSALALATAAGQAGPFGAGTLIVVRVGDGTAPLAASGAAVFIEERSPLDGTLIQTIPMPTTTAGGNAAFVVSGSATSEGFLNLSTNSQYLTMGGYGAIPGTTVVTAASTAVPRVIARIDLNGNVDTTTQLSDAFSAANIRSAASTDGANFWAAGSNGVRYATFGATTSTGLATNNSRVAKIFNGQLYASISLNVNAVGTGLPTTSGQTLTPLPGLPTAGTHSNYDYFFADANTLYICDDGTTANGGGVQKWTFNGTTWALQYTFVVGTGGGRGLAGKVAGGTTTLWAGSTTNPSVLYTVTDGGAVSPMAAIATAATNTAYRGTRVLPGTFGGAVEGACCLPNGTCVSSTSAGCTAQSGTYGGNFSDCSQVTCLQPGACCLQDGSCQVLSTAQCATAAGTYNGNGSTCGAVVCAQPGSCCFPDGTCQVVSQQACTAANGSFGGGSTTCATASCGPRSGACCAGNGTCSVTTAAGCTGTYRGDGTTCATASCGVFGNGNVVVFEVSSNAVNTASSVALKEIRLSDGATVQAVGLPAVQTDLGNRAFTLNGASTTEGGLNLSTDGHSVVLMGYNLNPGTIGPAASSASRVVARVDSSGRVNTTTAFTDGTFSASSPRGAASVDGTAFWLCGDSPVLANRGIRYATLGANSSTQLNDTGPTNNREIGIFNGNLYFSTGSGSTGLKQLGTGLPTTSGQTVSDVVLYTDPQGFYFSDASTLYIGRNANAGAAGAGVYRYHLDGTDWLFDYVMNDNGAITVPMQHITGVGSTLYMTTAEGTQGTASPGNKLYRVTDTGANSAFQLVATAPTTAVWKGVALAPVPAAVACYANCDASTTPPVANVADFTCFLQKFAASDPYANCDASTNPPVINVADFTCFLQKFAAGCP